MKILVTGCTGYVGRFISEHLGDHQVHRTSLDCQDSEFAHSCDLRNEAAVRALAHVIRPEVVIHAAGLKDIQFCESHADEAFAVNGLATENVAKAFGGISRIVYISTDYVFDGTRGGYREEDTPNPSTVYGSSKVAGEVLGRTHAGTNFYVVRTAGLFSEESSFVQYLSRELTAGRRVYCFTDTYFSPTYIADLVCAIDRILTRSITSRIFHVAGAKLSRFEFAQLVAESFGFDTTLVDPIKRPAELWYLLPNLSLDSAATQSRLAYCQTPHTQALARIAEGRAK